MGFFKRKKEMPQATPGADDFWGSEDTATATVHMPGRSPEVSFVEPASVRRSPQTLLQLLEPLFLEVCRVHRVYAAQKNASYRDVRSRFESLLNELDGQAHRDPELRGHLNHLEEPLKWFLDCLFGTADSSFPTAFWEEWSKSYMGEQVRSDDGNLVGGDLFFDDKERGLDAALATDARDPIANERLAIYYICIGLGLQGKHYDAPDKLRNYMEMIYPRISHLVDPESEARLTPDAYDNVNTSNFVAFAKDRPLILLAAFIVFMSTIALVYLWCYSSLTEDLKDILNSIRNPYSR